MQNTIAHWAQAYNRLKEFLRWKSEHKKDLKWSFLFSTISNTIIVNIAFANFS